MNKHSISSMPALKRIRITVRACRSQFGWHNFGIFPHIALPFFVLLLCCFTLSGVLSNSMSAHWWKQSSISYLICLSPYILLHSSTMYVTEKWTESLSPLNRLLRISWLHLDWEAMGHVAPFWLTRECDSDRSAQEPPIPPATIIVCFSDTFLWHQALKVTHFVIRLETYLCCPFRPEKPRLSRGMMELLN